MPILTPDYSDLNYEEMAKEIGLRVKHMPILIDSFLQESPPILEALQEAINTEDFLSIKEQAHAIKGSAGNLRFNEVYEMSREMELSAADENRDFDYEAYMEAVKKVISTITPP